MAEQDELELRLARIREATRSLAPPAGLVTRIERMVEMRRQESPVWAIILERARPLLLAAAGLAAVALAAGWRAELRWEAAVQRVAAASEVSP